MPEHTNRLEKPTFSFFDRAGYFRQLIKEIGTTHKGDRVALMTMPVNLHEPLVVDILNCLRQAALRGVHVIFGIDAFSFLVTKTRKNHLKPGPLWFHEVHHKQARDILSQLHLKPPFDATFAALESIRKAGGSYFITNAPAVPFTITHAGRSHIKLAVINNIAFLGGCNLEASTDLDIMVRAEHAQLANYLFALSQELLRAGNVRDVLSDTDQRIPFDELAADLYLDAGVRRQSSILSEALQLIDNSKEWLFFTCQYFPGGAIAKHLAQAQARGVNVKLVYSPPSAHPEGQLGHKLYNLTQRPDAPGKEFAHRLPDGIPVLHAKLLANEQGAMFGSHNYVTQGVRLGTAEIVLHVHDPAFSLQITQFLCDLLPPEFSYKRLFAK
jgi:hypothetical protein